MTEVAIYARVSTMEQSCDDQVERLTKLAQAHGWDPEVFRDDGISGIRDNRPALDRLRTAMRRGDVRTVLVTKIDRLGRSLLGIRRFWDEAEALGVRVLVSDQGFDSSSPTGRLVRDVLASIAEFERELILERTRAGVTRARAAGKRFGRPPRLTEGQRAECLSRLSNGESSRSVAQALKIPASTVRWIRWRARTETPPPSGRPVLLRDT